MKKISSGDLEKFSKKFGKFLGAGIPVFKSLEILKDENEGNILGKVSETTLEMLKSGKGVYESLKQFPAVFSKSYLEAVKAGEQNGTLDSTMEKISENIAQGVIKPGEGEPIESESISISNQKVIKFINLHLKKAVEQNASKLIITPAHGKASIKLTIDNKTEQIDSIDMELYTNTIARLKLMSCLDLGEKRLPQDGRILLKIGEKRVDIKIIILPTIFGEEATLRIINKENYPQNLKDIFAKKQDEEKLRQLINKPSGLIVFAGPSGSGKTTTLLAAGSMLAEEKKTVISVEDPVYFTIPGITQISVRKNIGLNMTNATKAAIRAETDGLMLSGILDLETAREAFFAANNGQMVLTQMSVNSPHEVFRQFLNLKIAPHLLYGGISGVVFQLLARKLCPFCQTDIEIKAKDITDSEKNYLKPGKYLSSRGCEKCRNTGYLGKMAIYEFVVPNQPLMDAIISGDTNKIEEEVRNQQQNSIKEQLFKALEEGETSLIEVRRILKQLKQ